MLATVILSLGCLLANAPADPSKKEPGDVVTPDRIRAIEFKSDAVREEQRLQRERLQRAEEQIKECLKKIAELQSDIAKLTSVPQNTPSSTATTPKTGAPSRGKPSDRVTLKQIEILGSEKVGNDVWADQIRFVEASVDPVKDRYYSGYLQLKELLDTYVALECTDESGSGYRYIFCDKRQFAQFLSDLRPGDSIGFRGTICSMFNGSYGLEISDIWKN